MRKNIEVTKNQSVSKLFSTKGDTTTPLLATKTP